jgi:hypothetical protein
MISSAPCMILSISSLQVGIVAAAFSRSMIRQVVYDHRELLEPAHFLSLSLPSLKAKHSTIHFLHSSEVP